MKTSIILQARMGSSRLPEKMLKHICGKSILRLELERLKYSKNIDEILVATTTSKKDDVIETESRSLKVKVFRGSEEDVLARYYYAAKENNVDIIVRVTGDCPLIDPHLIDKMIDEFKKNKYDYISNTNPPTYPDGLDVEVFSFSALEKAFKEAKLSSEREHVTPYIWKNKQLFKTKNIESPIDLSSHRWSVDTETDLMFVKKIYEYLYREDKLFLTNDILELLKRKPELSKINKNSTRNEGYLKSLKEDENSKKYNT